MRLRERIPVADRSRVATEVVRELGGHALRQADASSIVGVVNSEEDLVAWKVPQEAQFMTSYKGRILPTQMTLSGEGRFKSDVLNGVTLFLWAVLAVVLLTWAELKYGSPSLFSPSGATGTDLIPRPYWLVFGMFAGTLSRSFLTTIEKRKKSEHGFLEVCRLTIRSAHLWKALLASPLVLVAAYKQVSLLDDPLVVFAVAYQNGFFFQSVLGGARRS